MKFSTRVMALAVTLMILFTSFSITAMADSGIVYGIGFVNASGLNLRSQPSTDSAVLATANSGECVVVLGQENGWYRVNYNLQEGYMSADYLTVSTVENAELGYGTVSGSGVNLRSGPSTSHSKVGTASFGDKCYIIGLNQGWYKVLYNSNTCYIRSDYLSLTEIPYENQASSNAPKYFRQGKPIGTLPSAAGTQSTVSAGSATGAQILAKATQYLGTPYVYGGASPSGFDCSGLYTMSTAPSASAWAAPPTPSTALAPWWTRPISSPETSCSLRIHTPAASPTPAFTRGTANSSTPPIPAAPCPIPTSPAAIGASISTAAFALCNTPNHLTRHMPGVFLC